MLAQMNVKKTKKGKGGGQLDDARGRTDSYESDEDISPLPGGDDFEDDDRPSYDRGHSHKPIKPSGRRASIVKRKKKFERS
mmetsp:Transcript_13253/g.35640  ORF Transcript_13253/g.35640 Transcript_13253/m.35640 type:complete len:81 (+) Transcript_13253:65-307(+)